MKIFSSGGGVQSTAALVLAAKCEIDFRTFVFANTGDDSENPDTLDYVRNITMPYATENDIDFYEIRWIRRDGTFQSLRKRIYETERSIPIPARMGDSGAPGNRSCTYDYKIRTVDRWIAENNGKGKLVQVGLGITTDEIHRAKIYEKEEVRGFIKEIIYPLIDLNLSRSQCMSIIRKEGLPIPPKSSCYFCPFHTHTMWQDLKRRKPDLFDEAVKIEKHIQWKRKKVLGKDDVYLHPSLKPLDQAVLDQLSFFDEWENCESGYCMV
jgi:hypothetical protein